MALGKAFGCNLEGGSEGFGVGLVRSRSFGSKRVALAANDGMEVDCYNSTPTKRQCTKGGGSVSTSDKSPFEALPQDILIRVLCGVGHDDLKSLILVSKSISEATSVAKEWHFAYSTPKKTVGFRDGNDIQALDEFDEIGALAPKQSRIPRFRLSKKKLTDISVALFTSEGENWPRRELFMEMET